MNSKVQSNDEMRFLEIWDRIRKRIASPQCEMQEFPSILDTLTYYSQLAQKNCKPSDREIYSALCCVLREEVINRKEHFDETSKYIDASTVADSGFGTFHSESSPECGSKSIMPGCADNDQKVTSRRTKCIKARSQKILVRDHKKHRNLMHDVSIVNNVFDGKEKDLKRSTRTYPCMVTAIICCFACLIAFTPHCFFPWFFTLISFNSPPPL
ncbi:hypothetical protein X798_06931 [Onchocerca flexuosa]|uniref:RGS domain-containing protein n=2 Tax=Onchocerca flexuosa TaxID=387005 RepID=A0A183HKI6_9BILA|nr:hypothetical protein X798_06931 [Onchocerca flexuosa]VDO53561.1 unnamed protein product [Onchocerca flexuosa]